MQLAFEQVVLSPSRQDLLASLVQQSQQLNPGFLQIQILNHTLSDIQKDIHHFSTPQTHQIFHSLISLQYQLSHPPQQQMSAFLTKVRGLRALILSFLDPNQQLIRRVIQPISHDYQQNKLSGDKLQLCMRITQSIFENQSPTCPLNKSYFYMAGGSRITLTPPLKWNYDKNPLEEGLTLSFWFSAEELLSDVKVFSFSNKEKVGFEILLREQKLYYQRLEEEKKFSIIKSKSNLVYLCDVSPNTDSFLTVEFEMKKKIFARNYCVINVFCNNMTFNNIEVDIPTGNFKPDLVDLEILSNFKGKVYSLLAVSKNLYSLIEELHISKGFNTETNIRNLTCNFQNQVSKVIYFFTPIRAKEEGNNIRVFDVFHKNQGVISNGLLKTNISFKKDISYYGGLGNIMSFLVAIETTEGESNLFNTFLGLLKSIFINITGIQEEILDLDLFGCIREYLLRTKMASVDQTTIHLFKQIYVALEIKHVKQQYLRSIIWSLKPSIHLTHQLFLLYCNLIQSFYNQDIQTSLSVFDIKCIIGYIIDHLQPRGECCPQHSLNKVTLPLYSEVVREYFKIIQNILIFKRSDPHLSHLLGEIVQVFTLKVSICFSKVFLEFLERVCANDEKIENCFFSLIKPVEIRWLIYMFLANTPCFKAKTLILKLIFNYYVDDKFLNEKSTAFELSICMRMGDIENWKNSTLSHDDKRSHDSSEFGSEAKSTSLTEVVKYLDKTREFPIPQFVDQPQLIDTILEWSFKKPRPEDNPNNGLLLLSDVYKYSGLAQKKYIWNRLSEVLEKSRFDVEVLIWLTESLLEQLVKKESGDKEIISQILSIISQYHIYTIVSEEEHEIALIINTMIRSIFSFRFSRESSESAVAAYLQIFNSFIKGCNLFDISKLATLGTIIIKSCYKHLIGYFVSANFDTEGCFEEPEDEDSIVLDILLQTMENIYELLHSLVRGEQKEKEQEREGDQSEESRFYVINEENAQKNKKILEILFPQAPFLFSNSNKVSFMCMIFVTLQSVFQHLDELEIENHKRCLSLIEKFLVLQIQLTENCAGIDNIRHCLEEIKFIYINVLSFIEIKFYQYFYWEIPAAAKSNFNLENKLRNNTFEVKEFILDIFFTILQLLKHIDDMGSKQHKSFYELMKPKKSLKPKLCLLHTEWLKNIDEKIIEFYFISNLRVNAREKLTLFLLQRKISRSSTEIEKIITLNMQKFTAQEKTDFFKIEKKSLKSYQDSQREYYKVSRSFEEKINGLMVEYRSKQNLQESKRAHNQEKSRRTAKKFQYDIWEQSRLYEGFWASKEFYQYSQNQEMMKYNLDLSNEYKRKRSSKQTLFLTTPFIEIQINRYPIKPSCQDTLIQLDDYQQIQDLNSKTKSTKKSEKFIKMGLQFLKKKVIDRIIRSSSDKMISEETYFSDVMINKDMALQPGDVKMNRERIEFSYKPISPDMYHVTLLKFKIKELQPLSDIWYINSVTHVRFKKFLLKSNSIELFFKDGESVLLIFSGDHGVAKCNQFAEVLYRFRKTCSSHEDLPPEIFWKATEPSKLIQKIDLTKRWVNNQISNFEYLMSLNFLSGRSNNDLNQYPVLPWIFNGYSSFIDSKQDYRDFSKNMGCLGSEERKERFKKVYDNAQNFKSINHQYHFGFHYSNLPIVIQFLLRIQPYTEAAKQLQGGKFDVADRLFSSVMESYEKSVNEMSDVRELIPEFFYMPEFLINMEDLKLGVMQNGKRVDNVEIPLGFKTPYQFIEFHRQHLESSYVSQNIQKWIDLVFGYKNTGKEAEISLNKFYYLTYEQNLEILEDQNKTSTESQMSFFGKTPSQLFLKPHPQKMALKQKPINFSKLSRMRIIKEEEEKSKSKENINIEQSQEIIHLSYCKSSKRYIVVRKDGKGMIFTLAENETSFYSEIVKEFSLNLNTYEQIWIRDERYESIPIVSINGSGIVAGGYWGGRLMSYDILDDKVESNMRHLDTVTCVGKSETNRIIVSCSRVGEVIVWEYSTKMRMEYKNRQILHNGSITTIVINDNLKVYVTGGEDGLVNVMDLFNYKRLRTLKMTESITSVNVIIYPYNMILICSEKQQQCYSINGQLLSREKLEIVSHPVVFKQGGFRDRVLVRVGEEILFIKMPSFEVIGKHQLKKGDQKANNFIIDEHSMLYTVPNTVVCAQRVSYL